MRKINNYSLLLLLILASTFVQAGGISVDAGITPPQDRFVLRAQYRYMSMHNNMMSMQTQMTPLVLAYGVTPGITLMGRAVYVHRSSGNAPEVSSGLNDPFLLAKFRLYRKNTASYVIGIAPYIASNIPAGSKEISNRSWNPEFGLNASFRPRYFAVDISASYVLSDISGKPEKKAGEIFNLNTAISGQIPLSKNSGSSLSPVIEMTYSSQAKGQANPANDIIFLSPGTSFIYNNLALEILIQIPVLQSDEENVMKQESRLITGVKFLF